MKTSRPGRPGQASKSDRARPVRDNRPAGGGRPHKSERPAREERPARGERPFRSERPARDERPARGERPFRSERPVRDERPGKSGSFGENKRREFTQGSEKKRQWGGPAFRKKTGQFSKPKARLSVIDDGSMRLNRYIANAGVCSRREADMLIENGAITVNGEVVTQMGTKVYPGDTVIFGKQKLSHEKKVYILLNKPRDYITTTDDPHDRKTVLELIRGACPERVYPVGRLDRNTTGLLLLTNDGDLTRKLSHPSQKVTKLYHVHLDAPLSRADLETIASGIDIDGQKVIPDSLAWANENKREAGIELHSGQNRVVRRIFETLGYKVTRLDRVMFAGLTKKDLPRGKWRFLTEKEIHLLHARR